MTVVYAVMVVAMAAVVLWQQRDPSARRSLVFAAFISLALVAAVDSTGTPKPEWTEWRGGERVVVAVEFDLGRAIYIWTRGDPPVAYRMPWDEELAKKLKEGLRDAADRGEPGIIIDLKRGYAERFVHPPPVRVPPEKT